MYTPTPTVDRAAAVTRETGARCYFGTLNGIAANDGVATFAVVTDADLNANATIADNFTEHGYTDVDADGVYASFVTGRIG